MRIALLVEGKTEKAFKPFLAAFLRERVQQQPRLDVLPYNGPIPKGEKLRKHGGRLLRHADAAVALTDVCPGFHDAEDAKRQMRDWVGDEHRFHPHAAQHDFEAWLLPYWPKIQQLARHNMGAPGSQPERINHQNPPSRRIAEIFQRGKVRDYVKARDAAEILEGADLTIAANACPELKAFVNTLLMLCGGSLLP